jgi:hypothetical protein
MHKTVTPEDGSLVTVLPADDCLINTELAARICDMSAWSLRQRIARGDGPRVVRLSGSKISIRVRDLKAWIESRATPAASPFPTDDAA